MRTRLLHFWALFAIGAALFALGESPGQGHGHLALPAERWAVSHHRGETTLETVFELPAGLDAPGRLAGLAVPAFDRPFEIALNGTRVFHGSDAPDELTPPLPARGFVVPLPRSLLRPGENRLTVRAGGAGAPRGSFEIGDFATLWPEHGAWLLMIFVSLYALLGVFALVLSAALRFSFQLGSFGLFALALASFFTVYSTPLLNWLGSSDASRRLEHALLHLTVTLGLVFLAALLEARGRLRLILWGFAAINAGAALTAWVLPGVALPMAHTTWQAAGLAALLLGVKPAWRAMARHPGSASLLPGIVLLALATGRDIIAGLSGGASVSLMPYGVFVFVVALAVAMARQFLQLHREAGQVSTDLAHSERRLGAFYNATREGVCIRRGNVVLDVNPAFEALFGLPKERATGAPFTGFFTLESQPVVARGLDGDAPIDAVALRADGSQFDAELLNRAADPADPAVKVTAIRDITEFKRYRSELLRRNKELEELNRIVVDRELHMVELKRRIRARPES